MVFLGRPSEACGPCREGRLRCDQLQPGCTQCLRKQITCPGYRDPSDFYFRDETANAAFKVAGTLATLDVSPRPPPAEPSSGSGLVRYQTMSQPMDDLARTYFMREYIASSPFEYLPRLCPYGLQNNDALSASILAASFASLSLKVSEPKMMKLARIHYASALSQTNQALGSPKSAVEDSTLAAVLLLGLFEAIVYSGQQSLDSWNQHTLGTVELLRLRGTRQFDTPLGRQLFLHSSGNIRTSCAHSKTPVPPRFLKLYESSKPHLDLDDPFLKMTPIVDRVATLRSRIASLGDSERHEVLYEALDLDAATAKLGQKVPEEWRFTARHPGERAPMSYKGMSFRYPSLLVLRYWNSLRMIRMFLNDVIWIQSSLVLDRGPDPDDETDYEGLQRSASRKMSSLVVEVLGSCGEYLEFSEDRFSVSARCLIWPLSVIAEISLTPPDARRFALDCLDRLGRDGQIPLSVAEVTKRNSVQTDW
ncbi:C6 zinc finger domain-containing protein [Colletotrichum caudatum]|nr:C6 zinc finger domain-containing protein [Colletotrichum caudatum]